MSPHKIIGTVEQGRVLVLLVEMRDLRLTSTNQLHTANPALTINWIETMSITQGENIVISNGKARNYGKLDPSGCLTRQRELSEEPELDSLLLSEPLYRGKATY